MAKNANQITKIYEMRTLGFDVTHKQFETLHADLLKLKQAKQSLTATRDKLIDPVEIEKVGQQIEVVRKKEADLVTKSAGAYAVLNKEYKTTVATAQNLAAEFGTDSKQAIAAAESAQKLKEQLLGINAAIKAKPIVTATAASPSGVLPINDPGYAASIPFTHNLDELEKERVAIQQTTNEFTELELAEIRAAEASTRMIPPAKANADAIGNVGDAYEGLNTPLQQYTGTLKANNLQQIQYKARLQEINLALKAGTGNTAELVLEKQFLTKADAELTQTINAQVKYLGAADTAYDRLNAELGISRNLMRQLSQEERNSPFGKQLAADIARADVQLKKLDADMGNHQRNVGNYAGAFNKAWSFIRNAAYLIPGLGIAGIFGLFADGISNMISWIFKGEAAIDQWRVKMQLYNDVMKSANEAAGKEITTLKILYAAATDQTLAMNKRLAAVKALKEEYPDTFANLSNEAILAGKAKTSYEELTKAILESSRARAAKDKLDKIAAEKLDIEDQKRKVDNARRIEAERAKAATTGGGINKLLKDQFKTDESGTAILGFILGSEVEKEEKLRVENAAKIYAALDAKTKALTSQEEFLLKYVTSQKELEKVVVTDEGKKDKIKAATGSKVSLLDSEDLKLIEANRQLALAAENTTINQIQKLRNLSFDEEVAHVNRVKKINVDALNAKIKILSAHDKLNREELLTLAEFREDKSRIELDSSKKIQDIEKKRFAEQEEANKRQVTLLTRSAESQFALIAEDPTKSFEQKAQAKVDADNKILAAEEDYLIKLLQLNENYSAAAVEAAKAAVAKAQADLEKSSKTVSLSRLEDVKKEGEANVRAYDISYQKQRKAILDNMTLTDAKKKELLEKLEKANRRTILSAELESLNKQVELMKKLLDQGLISQEKYLEAVAAQNRKAAELSEASQGSEKKAKGIAGLLGFKAGTPEEKVVAEIIAQSYSLAQDAMHSFFDAERDRIQQSLDANLERLDREKEQVQARAQSQAEIDSLEKQYAAKKRKAEQEAGEQLKKSKKAEAKIALATEIANIWSTAFQLGPIGGPIAAAILTALALGRYALTIGTINREQFGFGGMPDKGGRIGGRDHANGGTPFNYEAEHGELAVIRTRNAHSKPMTISGTHAQIASALNREGGGISFAPGGRVKYLETGGYLGGQLQAPVFTPSGSNGTDSRMLEAVTAQANALDALKGMVLTLQVVQETDSVTRAQKKQARQNNIGVL